MSNRKPILHNRNPRGRRVALAILQGLLAALFLFAGVVKLTMPLAVLAQQTGLPGGFMRFIAAAEVLGALGLVLPGIFRTKQGLTPLAALGLVIIMMGAVTLTVARMGALPAIMPLVVGLLLLVVIRATTSAGRAAGRATRAARATVTTPLAARALDSGFAA